MEELGQNNGFDLFEESIKSDATKVMYKTHLKKYIQFTGVANPFFNNDPRTIEQKIIQFIISMKKEGKSFFSIRNHISPVLTFYKVNDIVLNVTKIKRYVPAKKRANRDRAYTHQEIQQLLDISDERMRVIILLLGSSGMRVGAIPLLSLRNLTKVNLLQRYGDINQIYKIIVYENEEEEYITFCTPECVTAIDLYLNMRSRYGEKLTKDSLLIREQFDIRDQFAITSPIRVPLNVKSITFKLRDIGIRAGLRTSESIYSDEGQKYRFPGSFRKEVPIAHGFRKFFSTQLVEADVKTELRWLLEGHNLKANDGNYIRTSEKRLQQEYEKAIDNLTINEGNRLLKKVETLQIEKSQLQLIAQDVAMLKQKMKRK
jgi:site-specific recombinase XerD